MIVGFCIAVVSSTPTLVHAKNATASSVTVRTLAQSPVKELPDAKVFVAILDFSQVPGAACGPVCQLPGFVYTLRGVATISSAGATARSVDPGEAVFTPANALHTNDKVEGRVGAGAIAVGLVVIVILLCAATRLRGGLRRAIIPLLSLLLITAGALLLTGATSNDWYFFAVRPAWQLSLPMPRPDGRVTFASPEVDPVPTAPYVETLRAITVPPTARYDAPKVSGPETMIVVTGTASVDVDGKSHQLTGGQATFAQLGQTLAIVNSGSDTLRVVDFALTPLSALAVPG